MAQRSMPPAWTAAGARWGTDGLLYLAEWRRGFDVHELRALFWDCQQVGALRRERDAAWRDLATAQGKIEGLERRVFWYRRQLVSESRLGLMLAGLDDDPRPGQARL